MTDIFNRFDLNYDIVKSFKPITYILKMSLLPIPTLHKPYNNYIEGQSYEDDESKSYGNIRYIVEYKSVVLGDVISSDGSFKIENLPNDKVNVIVIDSSNKYTSKFVSVDTQIDPIKHLQINLLYQSSSTALIRVDFSGDPTKLEVSSTNSLITKESDNLYKLTDVIGDFQIIVKDYVDGTPIVKEKLYKFKGIS